MIKLSVIVPVYNERSTVESIIDRVNRVPCEKEILVVDDGSTDGTLTILAGLAKQDPDVIRIFLHPANMGKGAAIRTALESVTGDIVVIQDADLEYHPEDYPAGIRLIEQGWADAVYGSRFLGPHRVFLFWHYVGNKFLTMVCNIMTSGTLTDMETGFKMIRSDVMRQLNIQSRSFDVEVEITVKLFRCGYRVFEMPITYTGRTYEEGKKITWQDGVRALRALVMWRWRARSGKR